MKNKNKNKNQNKKNTKKWRAEVADKSKDGEEENVVKVSIDLRNVVFYM